MTDTAQLQAVDQFLADNPHVKYVDLILTDLNGVQRGKRIHADKLRAAVEHGTNMTASVYALDVVGENVNRTGLTWDIGDADRLVKPVLETLVTSPWDPISAQAIVSMYDLDGVTPFKADPRHVLGRLLQKFKDDLGYTPQIAVEMEFYLVDREREPITGALRPPKGLRTGRSSDTTEVYGMQTLDDFGPFMNQVMETLEDQGVPVEGAIAEAAAGQFEINLGYQPDALLACDQAAMFKRAVKSIALRHGIEATFMAKPFLNWSGSGQHVHVSMLNQDGHNVFAEAEGEEDGSAIMHHAIAGLVQTAQEATAIFAPNANSYRRYVRGSYAPLAPTWGVNNRTVAFRVPIGPKEARRVEHRLSGADANAYWAVSAILAGMYHGMVKKLDAPKKMEGNAYRKKGRKGPRTWGAALESYDRGTILKSILGADVWEVYSEIRHAEMERFEAVITPTEYKWYATEV